jgi:gliding motility-associated-like protein
MKYTTFFVVALCSAASGLFAQNQNNTWYFGFHAGLSFNTAPPTPLESNLFTHEGTASLSDPQGKLLFYTNGATIWDRTHSAMPNGSGLLGGESSTQAALILPLPNSCGIYYVFNTEDHISDGGLYYSVVDMCLNNGLGDVVASSKNTLLLDRTAEKLTAVLHANGTDIWIITHKLSSREFAAFLLTATGINPVPVISAVGFSYPSNGHIGPAKANHRGDKIISAATFFSSIELFDFDNATGRLSNAVNLNSLFGGPLFFYGVEFSPNDSFLYATTTFVESVLYQLDLITDEVTILNQATGNYIYGALQLGPDGKIYLARSDSTFLDVIHQPDLKGTACQYEEKGLALLPGTYSRLGLPNIAPYSLLAEKSEYSLGNDTTICQGGSLVLSITPPMCVADIIWSDGSEENTITVNAPGTYWVQVESGCLTFSDSVIVEVENCCETNASVTLGDKGVRERGFCLSPTKEQDGFYVAGLRSDSLLLMKVGLNGVVRWSRAIDVVPGRDDYATAIITDSDGMIGVSGMGAEDPNWGGSAWIMRYNPYTSSILWVREALPHFNRDRVNGLAQNGPGGEYLLLNNPHNDVMSNDDVLISRFDLNTGSPDPFSKNFDVDDASEALHEVVYHDGFLYGGGRFTDGQGASKMRHAIMKMNADDLSEVWTRLGHQPVNATARLYGSDLIISGDHIYSLYGGDPAGTSTTNTKMYVQKSTLDGAVEWVKQYEVPHPNEYGYELVESDGGILLFDFKRSSPGTYYLIKINFNGDVMWAKSYEFNSGINTLSHNIGASQLIHVGNKLVFVGYKEQSGEEDIIIARTNLNGELNSPCIEEMDITVPVITVQNPVFYQVSTIKANLQLQINAHQGVQSTIVINQMQECITMDGIITNVTATICEGESYETYTEPGIYQDTFVTQGGCDSIRILQLSTAPQEACCGAYSSSILGDEDIRERGFCLSPTGEQDGFYMAGLRRDSLLLMEFDLNGVVRWSRAIDVVPGEDDYAAAIITDSEGMIGVSGMGADNPNFGGSGWVMRYDPYAQSIFWVREVLTKQSRDIIHGLSQNGPGGDYLLICNTVNDFVLNDDALITSFDMATGTPVTISKNFNVSGNSENLFEFHRHNEFLYGVGRFTDGDATSVMRHTLVKFNAHDLSVVWAKMGHQPRHVTARLYGKDMLISGDYIYSLYGGDPAGTSIINTKMYVQKTTLDGDLVWVKQYELPHANEYGYELVESDGGIVIFDFKRTSPGTCYLVKIDFEGNVLWSKAYEFDSGINTLNHNSGASQLIQVGNKLVFVGYKDEGFGREDIIIVRTDLNGETNPSCFTVNDILVPVVAVPNPVFYNISTEETDVVLQILTHQGGQLASVIKPVEECITIETHESYISATICEGESFESYTQAGTYQDTFLTQAGCDSVRILQLTVYPTLMTFIQPEICEGDIVEGYSQTGEYTDHFTSVTGCDSVRILHLTVHPSIVDTIQVGVCEGEVVEGYGQTGDYTDHFTSVSGCDSVRILHLTVHPSIVNNIQVEACEGETVEGYSLSGEYTDHFTSVSGCDSVRVLQLTVHDMFPMESFVTICTGSQFEGYTQNGVYMDTLPGIGGGCDTSRTIHLTVIEDVQAEVFQTICAHQQFEGYSVSGTYIDTFLSVRGCDSIRIIHLTELEEIENHLTVSLCNGEYHFTSPGIYIDTLVSFAGCDSIQSFTVEGIATYIPNVFSPNNDQVNDVFTIFQQPEEGIELHYFGIFDRMGNMAYETRSWPILWDGMGSHGMFNPGVFTYIFVYECGENKVTQTGDITLIR